MHDQTTESKSADIPLGKAIVQLAWNAKWLLLALGFAMQALDASGLDSSSIGIVGYAILLMFLIGMASEPCLQFPEKPAFKVLPVLTISALVLATSVLIGGFWAAADVGVIWLIFTLSIANAVSLAVVGPFIVRTVRPERTNARMGLPGRLWRLTGIACLAAVWDVGGIIALGTIREVSPLVFWPVAVVVNSVSFVAVVATAAVLVAAVQPGTEGGMPNADR